MTETLETLFTKEPVDEPDDFSAIYEITPSLAAELGDMFEYVGYTVQVEESVPDHLVIRDYWLTQNVEYVGKLAEEFHDYRQW